jgi:hypothetical protein
MTQRIVVLGRKVCKEMMVGSFSFGYHHSHKEKKGKIISADNP